MAVEIEFDAFDLVHMALYSERFNCVKEANGVPKGTYGDLTPFGAHYVGAMGEFALRKATGSPLDLSVTKLGNDDPDIVINGWTVQIKTSSYTGRDVEYKLNTMGDFNARVLVGVRILTPLKCEISGCISKTRFMKIHEVKDYGYGERLVIAAKDLSPIDILMSAPPQKNLLTVLCGIN